jgi:hypothetical protein
MTCDPEAGPIVIVRRIAGWEPSQRWHRRGRRQGQLAPFVNAFDSSILDHCLVIIASFNHGCRRIDPALVFPRKKPAALVAF